MTSHAIEDGALYEAKIIDQIVSRNRSDELQVVFTAEVNAKLSENHDRRSVESIGPFERDVFVTLSDDDDQRLRIALENLERLGFEDSDVVKLHPDHPNFCSMVGKEVQLRCKVKGDATYWNFAWSRSRPAALKLQEAQSAATPLLEKIEQMRQWNGWRCVGRPIIQQPAAGQLLEGAVL